MIAASARRVHASIVASADSCVALGGIAENPIRNVRADNPAVDGDVGDFGSPLPHPVSANVIARTFTVRAIDWTVSKRTPTSSLRVYRGAVGFHSPRATAGTNFSIPRGGKSSVLPCSAL